jgi:heme-degrading monooxygenase HmoA
MRRRVAAMFDLAGLGEVRHNKGCIPQDGRPMFIAMNRFKVIRGAETDFEEVWTRRDTQLRDVPGFLSFHLLRGPEREDHVLYSSHTSWHSRADFEAWTRSEAFRLAHRDAGTNRPLYQGHPEFEGFEVIQTVESASTPG